MSRADTDQTAATAEPASHSQCDEHLARRMPAPDIGIAARGRRIHRIFLRAQSLNHSPKATIAAIVSRIAQAKSKS